jgi:hypothetical protein
MMKFFGLLISCSLTGLFFGQLSCAKNQKNFRGKYARNLVLDGFSDNGVFPWDRSSLSLTGNAGPKVAFTGSDLNYECTQYGSGHLSAMWTQKYLLKLFEGNNDFFTQLLNSLGNLGNGVTGSDVKIIPEVTKRLGLANQNNSLWNLNNIRFRPDHIKFSYELDRLNSAIDTNLRYMAIIHAVAINTETDAHDLADYYKDIFNLSQVSEESKGCALVNLLHKWIIEKKGIHLFTHIGSNDDHPSVSEWRFSEARINYAGKNSIEILDPSNNVSCDSSAEVCPDLLDRQLTVVPLSFPYYEFADNVLTPSGTNFTVWFNGEKNDQDLILPINNQNLPKNHIIRNLDGSWTCIGCHSRSFGVPSSASETKLPDIIPNLFRHAGYGLSVPHGFPRQNNHAFFSEFFIQTQNRQSDSIVGVLETKPISCEGTENFDSIKPFLGECTSCHSSSNNSGRVPLETEEQWKKVIDAAAMFVKMGTMPPSSDFNKADELLTKLQCWREKIVPIFTCTSETNFDSDVLPYQDQCLACHNGSDPNRVRLTNASEWHKNRLAALQLIQAGTMPPFDRSEDTKKLEGGLRCLTNK